MKEINSIINHHIKNGLYPGVEWKIIHKNETYQGKAGVLNLSSKENIHNNSFYRIWSMTKPIISVVILQLLEEKKIKLENFIVDYLPQFSKLKVLSNKQASISDVVDIKKIPTIKDLLLHTAGFSYNFMDDPVGKEYHREGLFNSSDTTLEEEINLLSTLPLLYEPSTHWVYSVSVDVLARIIEVVTGSTLQEELKKRIFVPLNMQDTGFSITKENLPRLMTSYQYDAVKNQLVEPIINSRKIASYGYPTNKKNYARGGIGLFSTIDDYTKFAQMLLTGKTQKKEIILSKQMLATATKNHLPSSFLPYEIKNFDVEELEENEFEPYGFGLGFRVMIDPQQYYGIDNVGGSVGEFGWAGAASTYFLVDPKNDLIAVLMTQVFEGDAILKKNFVKNIFKNIK